MPNIQNIMFKRRSQQQVILFAIVIIKIALFQLMFPFHQIQSPLIIALIIWRYTLILLLCYDVWIVISKEPTDPVLLGSIPSDSVQQNQLILCVLCNGLVLKASRHCFRCGKCAYNFDHHCKYLNCCIGGANYVAFLKVLATFILYCIAEIVLILRQQNFMIKLGFLAITGGLMCLTLGLLMFHIYLNWCLGMSTLEYLMPSRNKNVKISLQTDELKDDTSDR